MYDKYYVFASCFITSHRRETTVIIIVIAPSLSNIVKKREYHVIRPVTTAVTIGNKLLLTTANVVKRFDPVISTPRTYIYVIRKINRIIIFIILHSGGGDGGGGGYVRVVTLSCWHLGNKDPDEIFRSDCVHGKKRCSPLRTILSLARACVFERVYGQRERGS